MADVDEFGGNQYIMNSVYGVLYYIFGCMLDEIDLTTSKLSEHSTN